MPGEVGDISNISIDSRISIAPRREWIVCVVVVAVGLALWVGLSLLVPFRTYRDEMPGGPYRYDGMFDPPFNSFDYFEPEKTPGGGTYQWTTAHATTTFGYAANAGSHAQVSVRLGAFQATEQNPIKAELWLNGQRQATLSVAGNFQVYTAEIDTSKVPNPYLSPAHIQLDILSTTRSTPGDARELGVAVDWIEVRLGRSAGELAAEGLIWLLLTAGAMWVGLVRFGLRTALVCSSLLIATLVVISLTYSPRAIPATVEMMLAGLGWLLALCFASRKKPYQALILAALLVWVVVAGRALGDWQMDDSYISYRYAWNLIHGYGLVYNVGEVVEGYTNFLWTMISAAGLGLGLDPGGLSLGLNIFISQCLLALTYYVGTWLVARSPVARAPVARSRPSESYWPMLSTGLLAVDVSMIYYGAKGSGMESTLFALMILLSVVLLWPLLAQVESGASSASATKARWVRGLGGLALALMSLVRPEGLFVAGLLLGLRLWQDRRHGDKRGRGAWRLFLLSALPFLAVALPYQVWRISFYGYPFPNTFYAKTGASIAIVGRGLGYVLDFALAHWLLVIPLLAGGVVWIVTRAQRFKRKGMGDAKLAGARHTQEELLTVLALLVAVYVLYIVAVGGDHFLAWRFFVPLLAPIILIAQEVARAAVNYVFYSDHSEAHGPPRATRYAGPAWGKVALGVVLGVALITYAAISLWAQGLDQPLGARAKRETTALEKWGSAALWLRDNTPPQTALTAMGAGALAYYSERTTIDLLGLNDLHIAHVEVENMGSELAGHEKHDPAYVLGRRPDYILATAESYFDPVAADLKAHYDYVTVRSQTGPMVKWLRLKNR